MKVLREISIFIAIFSILFITQANADVIFQDNFDDNDVSDWTVLRPYILSGGVIYGPGSGYDGSHGATLRHDIGSMNVGTGSFELTFRAISGSNWPNQAYVTLHTDDSHYIGLNVYGESSNYTLDLIEDGQYPYRYYIGPGVLNQWHTYTLARDDSGQFSLRIDGNLLSAWVPPINTKAYNFTAVQIVAGRRQSGIDWVKVSYQSPSQWTCDEILQEAVKDLGVGYNPNDGKYMPAKFTPKFGLTIDQAKQICGYDHFNWVQWVTKNTNWPKNTVRGEVPEIPYLDPPLGGWDYQQPDGADYLPGYLDRDDVNLWISTDGKSLEFADVARVRWPFRTEFKTALAGVKSSGYTEVIGGFFEWSVESSPLNPSGDKYKFGEVSPITDLDQEDLDFLATQGIGTLGQSEPTVDPTGGSVDSFDGFVSIDFPSGAIPQEVFVYITQIPAPPPSGGLQLLGEAYMLNALDAQGNLITDFSGTLEVTIQYDPNDLGGLDEQSLTMFYYGSWVPIPSTVDTVNHTVTGYTDHFNTIFGIFGIPEPSTLLLFGTGLIGILVFARRKLKKKK